jgi:peptidoglycan L-alanyl-D-glutamate endopeptidase CwlK
MINSKSTDDLHPIVKIKCEEHIANCALKGIRVIVTSTLRDDEYQATLYEQGRTKPGDIVTNLKVTGAHGFGLAYDVVPVVNGQAVWNNHAMWATIGEEGKKLGFAWGGDWTTLVDKPHFELTEGLSFTQLRGGARPDWFGFTTAKQYVQHKTKFSAKTMDFLDAYKFAKELLNKLTALLK